MTPRSWTRGRSAPRIGLLAILALLATGLPFAVPAARADAPRLILGTTVGLQQSGLLDVLVPLFEQRTARTVTVVAVSAPHVLLLGTRGELDVLLVDAGDDAAPYVADGHGVDRRAVLDADAVLVGPRGDPARVAGAASATDALRRIAEAGVDWVSRGDNSGLYRREQRLWRAAGVDPAGLPWYGVVGQGMAPTLTAATQRQAYALADRQTFLEQRNTLDLAVLVEGTADLLRRYDVIVADPARGAWIDKVGARAFADFLVGPEAQALVGGYGVERFGGPVFRPAGGRDAALRHLRRADL